ncbi:ROK family protein [Thalassospira sp.]|uniref:ROK family protein n=1 Tax=Thalassospira sp. TaxID=1912094 RepID=UPI002734C568|nr:ROK family protein [Thalassospira sp.]MDP2698765.1 ROK family protein [Thalassospira sp.]
MKYAFDIGGSKIEFGVFAGDHSLIAQHKIATPATDLDAFIAALSGLVGAADRESGLRPDIGISFAGGIDPMDGAVITANVPALKGWPIAAELSRLFDRKVAIANDADCFALAEAHLGAGQGCRTVFGIILGTGVGGGIVVDGRLLGGRSGICGEWGHGNDMSGALARHGLAAHPCGCGGASCLDPWGAARGLERIHAQCHGVPLPSHDITANWRAGDPAATRSMDIFIDLLAGPLAGMVNVLDPDCVPVGGGLASETALIDRIDQEVRRRVLGRYDVPLVVPGVFYRDGGLRGAGLLGDRA